jgi:endoglucanase
MPAIWTTHFGSLVDAGFAVIVGEYGGKYGTGDPKDKTLQDALTNYFTSKHMCSSFYWSWNPNSGDTGGILQDDWLSVRQDKMAMLNTYYQSCTMTGGGTKKTGDANGDGIVNTLDLSQVLNDFLKPGVTSGSDLNGDGAVNSLDLSLVINTIGK